MKTVKEVASFMGVSPSTVKIWIREHKLKAKITPKGYMIKDEHLTEFIMKFNK